jgi:hypothetical protein
MAIEAALDVGKAAVKYCRLRNCSVPPVVKFRKAHA